MTTITDSDIKEIKDAIAALGKQLNDIEKNLTIKISEVSGELKATNAKIDGLDKRISTLEFFYRAISLGLFGLFAAAILKYYFDHPLN